MTDRFVPHRFQIVCLAISATLSSLSLATDVGGPLPLQTTHWNAEQSPYIVVQNLEVPVGGTLRIDPGVEVRFGNYALVVQGTITARGRAAAPIRFMSDQADPAPGQWRGIQFQSTSPAASFTAERDFQAGCILEHCIIENGQGVIIDKAAPLLSNCTIRNNTKNEGGAILSWHASPTIRECVIERNLAQRSGGGIRTVGGEPLIDKCQIRFNTALKGGGGGISSDFSAPRIVGNHITHNAAAIGGGIATGVSVMGQGYLSTAAHSQPQIVGNMISHNVASSSGGGIHVSGTPRIVRNTIANNALQFGLSTPGVARVHTIDPSRRTTERHHLGAGVFVEKTYAGPAILEENQIAHNHGAAWGGGLHVTRGTAQLRRNAFIENSAAYGGGGATLVFVSELKNPGSRRHGTVHEVSENVFAGNLGGGLEFAGNGKQLATPSKNSFADNAPFALINHSPRVIASTGNWFGGDSLEFQKSVFDYYDDQSFGRITVTPTSGPLDLSPSWHIETWRNSLCAWDMADLSAASSRFKTGDTRTVWLEWKACGHKDLAGYRVYLAAESSYLKLPFGIGDQSEEGPSPIDVENATATLITGLRPGTVYYFSITAYDGQGRESSYSSIASARTQR